MGTAECMVDRSVERDEAPGPAAGQRGPLVHAADIAHPGPVQPVLHVRVDIRQDAVDTIAPGKPNRHDVAGLGERCQRWKMLTGLGIQDLVGVELQHPVVAGEVLQSVALGGEIAREGTRRQPHRAGSEARNINGKRRGSLRIQQDRNIRGPNGLRRQRRQHGVPLGRAADHPERDRTPLCAIEVVQGALGGAHAVRLEQGDAISRAEGADPAAEPGCGTAQGVEVEAVARLRVGNEDGRGEPPSKIPPASVGVRIRIDQHAAGGTPDCEQSPPPAREIEDPRVRRQHVGGANEAAAWGLHRALRFVAAPWRRGAGAIPWLFLATQPPMSIALDSLRPERADPRGSIAIVGNAPGIGPVARTIDAAHQVVRFNNAPGFGGRTGSRVTHLALVNRGGQMREWLADPGFLDRPVVRQAEAFILPFPMLPAEANAPEPICWTREALVLLRPLGKPVHLLPEALHDEARRRLARGTKDCPNPSTGFLVSLALLLDRPTDSGEVNIHGFGFAGWPGHPWAAERAWFAEAAAAGRLRLHPPEASDAS